ncbi:hypothetical protein ASPTUDRAFT_32991 [Aspergillus tubingensis CBS 134.48]|uniref:Uncharacterized protein n=1 Tax=Aspergillus tubingensis (strain CBS 134.48) TaxID=767770 RepID=A0A1L9MT61_ASPTC|nr:hypothetical protein ASPTUDRAFT_32991 [Aspergillus tubingensis CBS 134.48]
MNLSHLLLALLWWCVSTAAVAEETCDNAPPNDPIGIDLGHRFVFASYANSLNNFTLLGVVNHREYQRQIEELSTDHFQRSGLGKPRSGSRSTPLALLTSVMWSLFEVIDARVSISSNEYVVWTQDSIRSISDTVYGIIPVSVQRKIKSFLVSRGLIKEKLSLSDVTETLTEVLAELKATSLAAHGVNMTWAMVGVPDFFNDTLRETVIRAGQQVGITILEGAVPPRSFCTRYLNPAIDQYDRVLVVHQGETHCGVQLYDGSPQRRRKGQSVYPYLPLDPWSGDRIQYRLVKELVDGDAQLKTLVVQGRDNGFLIQAVLKTRLMLKGYDPAVELLLGLEPVLEDQLGGYRDFEDGETLDELPLNLDSWWAHGNIPDLVLKRSQIMAVENNYMETLANNIQVYLQAMADPHETRKVTKQERVDYAIVLTDFFDGDLVHRAVQEAIGHGVPIVGSLKHITMVAEGAARLAWTRRENLLSMRESAKTRHDEL